MVQWNGKDHWQEDSGYYRRWGIFMRFDGKTIIITGSSRGISKVIAARCTKEIKLLLGSIGGNN